MKWATDPTTKEQSVSLTMVCVTGAFCLIAAGLEMFELIKTTSIVFEMFGAACGLYWGRKFTSAQGSSLESKE